METVLIRIYINYEILLQFSNPSHSNSDFYMMHRERNHDKMQCTRYDTYDTFAALQLQRGDCRIISQPL